MCRQRSAAALAFLVAAASIFSGCMTRFELSEAIGPAPPAPPPPPQGFLRVYTPTEEYNDSEVFYYPHRNFTLLSVDGALLRYVRNADHDWDETPALTPLPVGSYKIRSLTRRSGIVTVPVSIELGRTTEVYLDRSFEERPSPDGEYVRLPNGEIVGWRVQDPPSP